MDKEKMELAKYRLEQSRICISSAKILLDSTDYKGAANRAYYAIFHCMRSVLALDGHDFAKHSGVSAYFRKEYIKTGIFDVEFSDIIKEAFDIRSDSDYDDFFVVSKGDVEEQIQNAKKFFDVIHEYVEKQDIQ
ncbi:MAG: HEPN domain-containing protein [Lachnospiraceae bacterium]|nr:HEPN domain-containing protein [Lachnospiraceae bacterium]